MALQKRPAAAEKSCISAAPDGAPAAASDDSGKQQISMKVDRHLLAKADALAKKSGITRSALVALALAKVLENGI